MKSPFSVDPMIKGSTLFSIFKMPTYPKKTYFYTSFSLAKSGMVGKRKIEEALCVLKLFHSFYDS